ncbi:MAG: hypothetical protein ACK4IX_06675, partial [Candidatus Sericytochromatia bacterium]
ATWYYIIVFVFNLRYHNCKNLLVNFNYNDFFLPLEGGSFSENYNEETSSYSVRGGYNITVKVTDNQLIGTVTGSKTETFVSGSSSYLLSCYEDPSIYGSGFTIRTITLEKNPANTELIFDDIKHVKFSASVDDSFEQGNKVIFTEDYSSNIEGDNTSWQVEVNGKKYIGEKNKAIEVSELPVGNYNAKITQVNYPEEKYSDLVVNLSFDVIPKPTPSPSPSDPCYPGKTIPGQFDMNGNPSCCPEGAICTGGQDVTPSGNPSVNPSVSVPPIDISISPSSSVTPDPNITPDPQPTPTVTSTPTPSPTPSILGEGEKCEPYSELQTLEDRGLITYL